MENMTKRVRQEYQELFNRLKTDALSELLRQEELNGGERQAIKEIANLPHPIEADIHQIRQVCLNCRSGFLEYVFQIKKIGDRARSLIELIDRNDFDDETVSEISEQIRHPFPEKESYDLNKIEAMLHENTLMLKHVVSGVDLTLKSRCPECYGDLIAVIVDNRGKNELRLKCRQQTNEQCRRYDWYMRDVDQITN